MWKNRIHVGAWNGVNELETVEKDFQEIAKSGMDFIIMTYMHDKKSEQNLAWAEKYNVNILMWDTRVNGNFNITDNELRQITEEYKNSPSFAGFALCDEPGMSEYPNLQKIAKVCKSVYPEKEVHINLLPMYAAPFVFGDIEFTDYLEDFAVKVPSIKAISTDTYPFLIDDNGVKTTYDDYLRAFDIQAALCRKYGCEFWMYIQSMQFLPNRKPDLADFRFQVYCSLAFGAKAILHFCYHMTPGNKGADPFSAIQGNGEKCDLWELERIVNNELLGLSDIYLQYTNVGAFPYKLEDSPRYLEFDNIYEDDRIKNIDSTESLLFGVFEKNDNKSKAYVIVNMAEMQDGKMAEVSLEIDGAKKVTAYIKAVKVEIEPVDGNKYQFSLDVGEGIFLTVD